MKIISITEKNLIDEQKLHFQMGHPVIDEPEENIKCEICGIEFKEKLRRNQKNSLRRHMKDVHGTKHTTKNQYKCDYCELIFTRERKLRTHVSKTHKGQ